MNPVGPSSTPASPPAPQSPKKRMEELRTALKAADTIISEYRTTMDNHARSRRYRDLSTAAAQLAERAKAAQAQADELDKLMTEAQAKQGKS